MKPIEYFSIPATGYVQDVVLVPSNAVLLPITYGITLLTAPTDDEIINGTKLIGSDVFQTFPFPTPTNQYLWVAIPVQLGRVETFQVLSFPVSFNKERRRIFINGFPYVFEVHTTDYPQNGVGIIATANP